MIAESGFHQLGDFFDRIGKLPRIVNLGDFRLSGIERPTGTVRAELTLDTYIFRPEGAPPPVAKPGQPGQPAPAPAAGGTRSGAAHARSGIVASSCGRLRRRQSAAPPAPVAAVAPAAARRSQGARRGAGPGGDRYEPKGRRDPFAPLVLASGGQRG